MSISVRPVLTSRHQSTGRSSRGLSAVAAAAFLVLIPRVSSAEPPPDKMSAKLATLVTFEMKAEPATVRPGEVTRITIRGTLTPGFHTYPLTARTPQQADSELPKLTLEGPGLVPLSPVTESDPEFVKVDNDFVQLQHVKPFTWSQDVLVSPDTAPGDKELTARVTIQVCNEKNCYGLPSPYPPFKTTVKVAGTPVALSDARQKEVAARTDTKTPVKEWTVPADLGKPDPQKSAAPDPLADPFAAPAAGQKPAEKSAPGKGKKLAELIAFSVAVKPATVRPGETVTVVITGTPKAGYHTYPLTRAVGDHQLGQLSTLAFEPATEFRPLWPVTESEPVSKKEGDLSVYLEHENRFTWSQELFVAPTARPGKHTLAARIRLMVCDDRACVGPADYPPVEATIMVEGTAAPVSAEMQRRLDQKPPDVIFSSSAAGVTSADRPPAAAAAPPARPGGKKQDTLLGFMAAAAGSAVLMLLTPCVFPMIPITVSFFHKQSEKQNVLVMAAVYCVTIVVVLSLAMFLLGSLFITLANDPWVNLAFGLVLLGFALSLFGMYELELPSFLSRFTSSREGSGGYVGVFFMALTFTITSFTCTGPFLGPVLAVGKETKIDTVNLVAGAVTYSATFAAPFFFLALFPRALKKLPKGGNWMNVVKVVMGFLELALAFKFLAITDAAWNPGQPWFFNRDTVLCSWIVLSAACGLYLLGTFRLPHDYPEEHLGVPRLLLAVLMFGLAIYMTPLLWGDKPLGVVGEQIDAFLPLGERPSRVARAGGEPAAAEFAWHMDYKDAWDEAVRTGKPIFVDFTGTNCVNCRANEKNVFVLPEVRQALGKYVRVQLYTDTVPKPGLSAAEAKERAKENYALQDRTVNDVSLPFYLIINPAKDAPIEDGKLKGERLGGRSGKIFDAKEFERFVRDPQGQQVARQN